MSDLMYEPKTPFPDPARKRLLMSVLRAMGGFHVQVAFAGSGDSGSIEDVDLLDSDGKPISLEGAEFEWHENGSTLNPLTNKWERTYEVKVMPMRDILQQITEDCLDMSGHDWYNNEGGQGSLEIDLSINPPEVRLNIGINQMHTEDYAYDYSDEGLDSEDFEDEEEAETEAVADSEWTGAKEGNNAPASS